MAMYCPQCSTEYRDGFTECSDCRVALVSGRPPAPPATEHEINLVTVLASSDPFAVNLAKATLDDAGIEFTEAGDDPDERRLTGMAPAGASAAQILVDANIADQARELLEPILHPEPIAEEPAAGEQAG